MKTIYCKPEDVSKHNVVGNFPNPNVRKCVDKDGNQYFLHIIKPTDNFHITVLTESEIKWHCQHHVGEKICMITMNTFFPKDLVSGVVGGRYTEASHLSEKTGWVMSINTGSQSECFCIDRVQNAINLIKQKGYIFDKEKSIKEKIISSYSEKLKKLNASNISVSINDENEIYVYCKFFGNDEQSKMLSQKYDIFIKGIKDKIKQELETTTTFSLY